MDQNKNQDKLIEQFQKKYDLMDVSYEKIQAIINEAGTKIKVSRQEVQIDQKISNNKIADKPKTKLEKIIEYQQKNGLSTAQKRQQIMKAREYKKDRESILLKNIQKANILQGKKPCSQQGCRYFFSSIRGEQQHIIKEHKVLADRMGLIKYECEHCDEASKFQTERGLITHQKTCYQFQIELLKAKGQLLSEDGLNSQEELEFQESKKYN